MSSYADKAAKKGSIGDKINVDEQEVEKDVKQTKKEIVNKLEAGKEKAKAKLDSIDKKDIEDRIEDAENAVVKFFKYVSASVRNCANFGAAKIGEATVVTKEELKNPVVASQAVITVGAVAAGIYAYQERFRIKRIPEDVLYVYAGLLTGLVVLDGFVFNKLYGKYKK